MLRRLTEDPERPYVVVLGGSKVSDKLGVIDNLLAKADRLLIGGGMVFTFLKAQGHEVGKCLLEEDQLDTCRGYLARAEESGVEIVLPTDIVVAPAFPPTTASPTASYRPTRSRPTSSASTSVPSPAAAFAAALADAETVFWNGPMGVFEIAPFAGGHPRRRRGADQGRRLSVVGGGDSAAAVRQLGFDEAAFGHISTGGGASLEYLEGKTLPGIAVLERLRVPPTASRAMPARPLMAGNWKMNLNHQEAVVLVQKLAWTLTDKKHDYDKVEVVVLPPFTDLRSVQTLVDGDQLADQVRRPGRLGARRAAPTPARSRGRCWPSSAARYVVSGTPSAASTTARTTSWSTPRRKAALGAGMTPIVCVGEGLDVRQAGEHVAYTLAQLDGVAGRVLRPSRSAASWSPTSRSGRSAPARSPRPRTRRRSAPRSAGGSARSTATTPPTASASSTAARSRPPTSPASWPRPTSTAASSAAPASRPTSSAGSAASTTCRHA